MKSRLFSILPLIGCLAFVSCYPLPDKQRAEGPPKKNETVTSQDQQKIQEQRDRMKENEEKVKTEATSDVPKETPETTTTTTTPDKPVEKPRSDYSFANPVPGKEGFVFSPYNNKLVDVRDIPSGTLVQDPTYPASEKKYFRVP
jgi:cytoskeletal protein RodZ